MSSENAFRAGERDSSPSHFLGCRLAWMWRRYRKETLWKLPAVRAGVSGLCPVSPKARGACCGVTGGIIAREPQVYGPVRVFLMPSPPLSSQPSTPLADPAATRIRSQPFSTFPSHRSATQAEPARTLKDRRRGRGHGTGGTRRTH